LKEPVYPEFDGSQTCAQTDPIIWFPSPANQSGALAKKLCNTCPWIQECLAYAIQVDVQGIWGGSTEKDRTRYRRLHKIKAVPLYNEASLFGKPMYEKGK
jgi:WhiB family redox-sensing transcriptional regulator